MCGSVHVSAATRIRKQGSNKGVCVDFKASAETWSSTGETSVRVGRARTCLACGHVMLFMDAIRLAELRQGIEAGWQAVDDPADD
jgi:hypothetical protein